MTIRVVFMGSPEFALPSLDALTKQYEVVGVVTQPDRPAGRGRELKAPPVKTRAQELNLPVIQPLKLREPEALTQLQTWKPDLIVVAAFGQILRKEILELPRYGCINVHASALPRWRGAAPINAAILAGDEETGATIMQMDAGLDTGPMLALKKIRIQPDDTADSLFQSLSALGANLLMETLPKYIAGEIVPQAQADEDSTYAPMLKKADGHLDFRQSAAALERRVRAMTPWPGAWFEWNGAMLKVRRASVGEGKGLEAGRRLNVEGRAAVQCADGILFLDEVQPPGKKPMSGKSFLLGARNWETAEDER
ncbi:MAG: methionyl-tRNA formyltransferase [Anaerolineales bacterium]|nr:methionyl-tRNA formyltransferase [Anaerolineales bacterium]